MLNEIRQCSIFKNPFQAYIDTRIPFYGQSFNPLALNLNKDSALNLNKDSTLELYYFTIES